MGLEKKAAAKSYIPVAAMALGEYHALVLPVLSCCAIVGNNTSYPMKTLNMKLTEDQMDALHRYACSRLSNKTAVVREWIDSLPRTCEVMAVQPVQALSSQTAGPTKKAKRVGFNHEPVSGMESAIDGFRIHGFS